MRHCLQKRGDHLKKQFSTKVKAILVIALLLAIGFSIVSSLFGATWPEKAVQAVLTPIRSGVSSIVRQVERYYNYIFGYEALEAENKYLKERIAQIEDNIREVDALERENRRLEELLDLKERNIDYDLCSAYIVSWDSSSWKSSFTIAKGSSDGLAEGMVAVTEYGQVVGVIGEVGPNWASVTTVLDSSLEISASISSSGHTGVVQGAYTTESMGKLRMKYLPIDAVLRNNDQVVTTGSANYPKDLVLGYIEDAGIDETGVSKYAILTPAVEFDTLEQVFILTQFQAD